jgi:hypothetical protein
VFVAGREACHEAKGSARHSPRFSSEDVSCSDCRNSFFVTSVTSSSHRKGYLEPTIAGYTEDTTAMSAVIPFPAGFRSSGCNRSSWGPCVSQVIDLRARRAGYKTGKGSASRSSLLRTKIGTAAAKGIESRELSVLDFAAVICLALMIAGIFGLLGLCAPRATNLESIDRIVDPFAMQQLHRA